MTDFTRALAFVLEREGGYVNNKNDRGGATNKGITQVNYDAYRAGKGEAVRSVKEIEDAEVSDLYRAGYWNAVHGDELAGPIALVTFDGAVNHGPGRAIKLLQKTVGAVEDGAMGKGTIAASEKAAAATTAIDVAHRIITQRSAFYDRIVANDPTQAVFIKGWKNRLDQLSKEIYRA